MRRRGLLVTVLAALAVCVAVGISRIGATSDATRATPSSTSPAIQPKIYSPASAPPLDLVDQEGQPFNLAQLHGRSVLVSFGYSHCPDVCPTTLAIDRDVAAALPDSVAVVFVTIDPDRDTAPVLKTFLGYFSPRFVGLTGSPSAIRTAADAWGITYLRGATGKAGGYSMIHTAGTFVVDPEGALRFLYPYGTPDSVLVAAIQSFTHP